MKFNSSTNSVDEPDTEVLIPGLKLEWDHHTVSALRYFLEGYQHAVQEAANHALMLSREKTKLTVIRCLVLLDAVLSMWLSVVCRREWR